MTFGIDVFIASQPLWIGRWPRDEEDCSGLTLAQRHVPPASDDQPPTSHLYNESMATGLSSSCSTVSPESEIRMNSTPSFHADFDDSYFDKDCHGTVRCHISVRGDGHGVVSIRRWGDEAGQNAYDSTITTRIDAVLSEAQVIRLEAKPWYLDLQSKRPIDGSRYTHWVAGPALPGPLSEAHLAHAARGLATIVVALGGPTLVPPPLPLPTIAPASSHRADIDLGEGFRMNAVIRPAYTRTITPMYNYPSHIEQGRDTLTLAISRKASPDLEALGAHVELRDNGSVRLFVTGGLEVRDRVTAAMRAWRWSASGQ